MLPLQEAGPTLGRVAEEGAWLCKPQQHRRSRKDSRDTPQFSLDFQKPKPQKQNKSGSHQWVELGMLLGFPSLVRRAQGTWASVLRLSPLGRALAALAERTQGVEMAEALLTRNFLTC